MKKQRNLRSMAAQAVEQVVEQGQSLSNILPPLQQKVSDKDKALLQELCFGVLRTLSQLVDAKGDVVTNIKIHNELIGLPLSALKTIPVRVGVAGGENKAEAIAAAMKGGYINALVTDQDTAAAILRS